MSDMSHRRHLMKRPRRPLGFPMVPDTTSDEHEYVWRKPDFGGGSITGHDASSRRRFTRTHCLDHQRHHQVPATREEDIAGRR